ncbi:MAG: B12-binding domain-containing radical SAM protein [Deltaproteobacteria bacterium]|nr:B12-binding domain-containing radical SAM protein [Deltaproteobacteria bacterium]
MKVLLTTLHSRYIHSSLALPCLAAACRHIEKVNPLIREFTINEERSEVLSRIAREGADVIAFSCYIWNIKAVLSLAKELKKNNKTALIVLGGPEVSFDSEKILRDNSAIDFVVKGEGEQGFSLLLRALSQGSPAGNVPGIEAQGAGNKIKSAPPLLMDDLDHIPSPFRAGLVNMSKPLIYYETSRGCPFTCAFCLSSMEDRVRSFSMARIKDDLAWLMEKEASTIKFVDRTFNYHAKRANEIWCFILEKTISSQYHFEIAADLLTNENMEVLKKVPPAIFRFEIGVQSVAEETLHSVGRKSDLARLFTNVRRLVSETRVHVHLDLVAGLPGEDFDGFLASLERLFSMKGHHIQVEPLKVLKGAPMMDIAGREGYLWSPDPPYKIIKTPWLAEEEIEKIEIMGQLLERIFNSGRFRKSLDFICRKLPLSRFFSLLADFWIKRGKRSMPLDELFETIAQFGASLPEVKPLPAFYEAISFDRAMAGYPLEKGLPFYFQVKDDISWNIDRKEIARIRQELNIAPTCMVKAFRWTFEREFHCPGRKRTKRDSPLLFIYLSEKGKKQEVKIKACASIFPSASSL